MKRSVPQGGNCKGHIGKRAGKLLAITDCTIKADLLGKMEGKPKVAGAKAKATPKAAPSDNKIYDVNMGSKGGRDYAKFHCGDEEDRKKKTGCAKEIKEKWKSLNKDEKKSELSGIKEEKLAKKTISAETKEEERLTEKGERRTAAERGEPYKPDKVDAFL